jgi:SAM-dependent methyltransferase
MGRAIADDIVAVTGLGPDERVLEVGCGAGRVAVALLERLGPEGSYEGFDVVPPAIRWCRRRISARHPGFGFTLVDVASSHYRPGAAGSAAELVFPYPDAEFDVAFATSLFTHLAPDATANYLGECARVLRPGGRLFATFFLVDEWTRDALAAGRGTRTLHPSIAGSWIEDPRDPHAAVAHDQDRLGEVLAAAGLVAEGPLRGNWCGREAVRHQDVVVARRT